MLCSFFSRRSRRSHTQNRSALALRASRFRRSASALTRSSMRFADAHIVVLTGVSYPLRHAEGGMIYLMTTLVAVATPGYAVFAADSQITEDNLRSISTSTPKIVRVGDDLVGCCGAASDGEKFIAWYLDQSKKKPKLKDFQALILTGDGKIFEVWEDLTFLEVPEPFFAAGSGREFALGSMAVREPRCVAWALREFPEMHEDPRDLVYSVPATLTAVTWWEKSDRRLDPLFA